MPPSGYVELHCHSGFSFLDGASSPEELALEAAHLGYPALALTDHHGLYGSMAFAQAATRLGLQAITGAEVTLDSGAHLTLLAETATGYANLCRLITTAHLGSPDRRDPRLPFSSLIERHEGLIVLSGCRDGLLPKTLDREGTAAGRRLAELCRDTFGSERFFVELQRNGVRGDRDAPGRSPISLKRWAFRWWPPGTCITTTFPGTGSTTCWWRSRTAPALMAPTSPAAPITTSISAPPKM